MNMFKANTFSSPDEYIENIEEQARKDEMQKIHDLIINTVPKLTPLMLNGMIGYGPISYKSPSGREGEWAVILLASQKNYISLYICASDGKEYLAEKYSKKLGKVSVGKSCIRFKKIEDLKIDVMKEVIKKAEEMQSDPNNPFRDIKK